MYPDFYSRILRSLFYIHKYFDTLQRSRINKNIHAAAVNFVVFSLLLQQIVLLCFNILRGPGTKDGDIMNARVIVSITFIVFYCLIFMGSFFWQAFKGISPIQVGLPLPPPPQVNFIITIHHFSVNWAWFKIPSTSLYWLNYWHTCAK